MGSYTRNITTNTMKLLLIATIILAAEARPQGYAPVETYPDEPPVYTYTYGVADDYSQNNFGQTESRDGYNTQGEYYVNLPYGRLQKVTYTVAGDAGYWLMWSTLARPNILQSQQEDM